MSGPPSRRIHHLDVVVRDLDRAVEQYRAVLGVEPGPRENLPERGIDLVRFRVGETWLILVQPTRSESPVMRFLEEHGEGFFHMAIEVDDVEARAGSLAAQGIGLVSATPRRGVEGWKLIDIEIEETLGAMVQLVEVSEG
jgi:methylmalonyl-CoA/ethylmalonyl-CoA epimerase